VRTDAAYDDDRSQDGHAIIPQQGHHADERDLAQNHEATRLNAVAPIWVRFDEKEDHAGEYDSVDPGDQPLGFYAKEMAPKQDARNEDVGGAARDIPGSHV